MPRREFHHESVLLGLKCCGRAVNRSGELAVGVISVEGVSHENAHAQKKEECGDDLDHRHCSPGSIESITSPHRRGLLRSKPSAEPLSKASLEKI